MEQGHGAQEGREQQAATAAQGRRASVRARVAQLRGSRQRGIVGLPELVALSAAGLLLLATLISYFYFLRPERARLAQMTTERLRLEQELQAASVGVQRNTDTQASVQEILDSLETFETTHLSTNDSVSLFEDLNAKILRNKLRISGGVSYTQLEEAAPGTPGQPAQQQQRAPGSRGASRAAQSVFPGMAVTATVEGTYANLRRFIRDVEGDTRHFVVIDAVELEGLTETAPTGAAPDLSTATPGDGATPATPTPNVSRGALVSLRLDMAAYFRRLNAAGGASTAPTQP
ncbi:MAG TPA: hypothetical protein VGV59_11870 [Pyrinomonadaceae bacterium]|nr:hypothetical protein [Pyrinomonadaceae bacterium]